MVLVSQPRPRIPAIPLRLSPGKWYVVLNAKRCRMWNDDRLRSYVEFNGLTVMSLVFDVRAAPHAVAAEIALEYV